MRSNEHRIRAIFHVALAAGILPASALAQDAPVLKCPEMRKHCAVGLVTESGKSHSFRVFQASETLLVGMRRQLSTTADGKTPVDLAAMNGQVLILEYDEVDRKMLLNVRIISRVPGR